MLPINYKIICKNANDQTDLLKKCVKGGKESPISHSNLNAYSNVKFYRSQKRRAWE